MPDLIERLREAGVPSEAAELARTEENHRQWATGVFDTNRRYAVGITTDAPAILRVLLEARLEEMAKVYDFGDVPRVDVSSVVACRGEWAAKYPTPAALLSLLAPEVPR